MAMPMTTATNIIMALRERFVALLIDSLRDDGSRGRRMGNIIERR